VQSVPGGLRGALVGPGVQSVPGGLRWALVGPGVQSVPGGLRGALVGPGVQSVPGDTMLLHGRRACMQGMLPVMVLVQVLLCL
jgi:hypothetical protein